MKHVIVTALLVLTSLYGTCQCNYSMNETDEFTGKVKKALPQKSIGSLVTASLARVDTTHLLTIRADIGCTNTRSTFLIKFADGSILTFKHLGKIDCGDQAKFMSLIPTSEIERLKTQKIVKVRIQGTEGYLDFELKDPNYFKSALDCIK